LLNPPYISSQWAKSPKIQSDGQNRQKYSLKECVFVNVGTQNTVPCQQKYTLTDCFFSDFAEKDADLSPWDKNS